MIPPFPARRPLAPRLALLTSMPEERRSREEPHAPKAWLPNERVDRRRGRAKRPAPADDRMSRRRRARRRFGIREEDGPAIQRLRSRTRQGGHRGDTGAAPLRPKRRAGRERTANYRRESSALPARATVVSSRWCDAPATQRGPDDEGEVVIARPRAPRVVTGWQRTRRGDRRREARRQGTSSQTCDRSTLASTRAPASLACATIRRAPSRRSASTLRLAPGDEGVLAKVGGTAS